MLFSSTARKSNQVLSSNGRFAKKFEILPRNKQKLIKQPSESMESTTETADQREVRFTYEELLIQNRSLSEELTQCRADKDFVWTLWKRLQTDKPDVSSAVSMVIAREQEKAETKDQKVLVILKEKDNNIKILQEIAADLEVQLKQSMERLSGLLVERTEWEGKLAELQSTVNKLNEEKIYQQDVMKAREVQSEIEQNDFLSRIESLNGQKDELEKQLKSLQGEVETLTKKNSEIENVVVSNTVLKNTVEDLEKDLKLTKEEHQEQVSVLQSRETQLLAETAMVKEQIEQIEQKDAEIAALSAELKKAKGDYNECFDHVNEQSEIVRNLQLLQDETQQVLRNQQDSHSLEVKSYKATLRELRQKCIDLQSSNEKLYGETEALRQGLNSQQKKSTEKDMEIADLRQSLTRRYEGYDSETQTMDQDCNHCRELEEKLEDTIEEVENMKDIIHERGRRISSLEKVLNERRKRNLALKENELDVETDQADIGGITERFKSKIEKLEKEIEDLDALLSLKDNELQETKRAHNRRLQRYKSLRENYVMVNEQLRTFEHESSMVLHESTRRADPKSLQHENSESVWNELAFFRKQYKILKKEREEFEEEIDTLRVKNAEKGVQMKQIELKLHEEEEECSRLRESIRSRQKFISPSKLYSTETQLEVSRNKMKQLERQKEVLQTENEALKQRERYYKDEIASLTDEIDNIHRNIKEKIDAEVQASEMMMTIEKEANRSLDRIADSISANAHPFVEQYIQTSPISPYKKRSPLRPRSQLTQGTQTTNSEDESSTSELLKQSPQQHRRTKLGKEKVIPSEDLLSLNDLKLPRDRKRQKTDGKGLPVSTGRILKKRRMPPRSSPAAREHTSLKVRVLSLEQQVDVLRNAKIKLSQELQEKKDANDTIEEELESATRKLDMNRLTIRKFSEELDRVRNEREELEKELEAERGKNKVPELGYKELENRWKLATTESAKLSFQVKTLRGENEMLTAKQKEYQERTIWLERQLNQKKQLLEEFKEKLKDNMETMSRDQENLEETKKKNKALTVNAEQRKQYVEDLRNKINDILGEKLALKQKLSQCEEDLKKKSRLLQQSQDLCNHAEKAVNEMEKAAFDQLQEQALQQEKTHKKMKTDMSNINKKTQEYQWIIKNLFEAILKDAHRLRVLISERRRQKREEKQNGREAMKEARDLACSILNMTSEDLESLMGEEEDTNHMMETNDNEIREKLEEYLKREAKFSKHLLKLLYQILDQYWNLKLQEYIELHHKTGVPSTP